MESLNQKNILNTMHDVIHGEIILDDLAQKIIATKEFKRLNGITQTGTSKYAFSGLKDENRYYHSLGSYYIMGLIIERFEKCLEPYGISISPYHKKMAKTAMLLHDIGHGPMSHTMEGITGYPHEQMTIDIIKNENGEIHKVLVKEFSDEQIDSLISFIDYEYSGERHSNKKDNIIDVLKLLVSNQIDADRLDYLMRDAYYAGYKSLIDLDKIINGFNITIDKDRWLFIGSQNCLSQFETVLFERLRNYRDIYYHPASILGDNIIANAVTLISKDEASLKLLKKEVRDMIEKKDKIPLKSFLELDDKMLEEALDIINKKGNNELLSYACDIEKNLNDYIEICPEKNIESICRRLRLIFSDVPNIDNFNFIDSKVLIDSNILLKTYKSNNREGVFINRYGTIADIDECSNVINKNPSQHKNRFINFNLLRLYLGMDEATFKETYTSKIDKLMGWINYPEKEFELKYVIRESETLDFNKIVKLLQNNGFNIVHEANILNTDHYYDTKNLDYFKSKKSMRIRQTESPNDKIEYEVTFKSPTGEKAKFSTRNEKSDVMTKIDIDEAKKLLENKQIDVKEILSFPVLKVINHRHITEVTKKGVLVEVAFDNVTYNNLINGLTSSAKMIEIEPKLSSEISDRIILNEIFDLFDLNIPEIMLDNNPNKYYTGLTTTDYSLMTKDTENIKESIKIKKCKTNNK